MEIFLYVIEHKKNIQTVQLCNNTCLTFHFTRLQIMSLYKNIKTITIKKLQLMTYIVRNNYEVKLKNVILFASNLLLVHFPIIFLLNFVCEIFLN